MDSPNQRLFEDEIVADLLPIPARLLLRSPAICAALTALFEAFAPGIPGALLCRTRRIDDAVRDAIQEFKKRRLSRLGVLPSNLRFVSTDFNTERLDRALERGGLRPSEPAVFVWEGVSQYLKPDAADSVFRSIAERPKRTELVFTYVLEEVISGMIRPGRSEAFRKSVKRLPEPWYFGVDPSRLSGFLAARGLTLHGDFGAQDYQAHYLRPVGRQLEVSEIERVAIATV
ncbi:MAG TPA: class I SAM-dependent methyltransferase [Bryobacteraceae bacterium]|nr:class I SAM-dependent methyltransferase [Bryobacteraceae bacterium]